MCVCVCVSDYSLYSIFSDQIKLRTIRDNSTRLGPGIGLGTLTTENRTTWAKVQYKMKIINARLETYTINIYELYQF